MYLIVTTSHDIPGFNRYMVECESKPGRVVPLRFSRFNRYMVECEFLRSFFSASGKHVLIDTWWNVNVIGFS